MDSEAAFGPFVFSIPARQLYFEGTPVSLNPKERELLALLARHRPDIVTRETILDELWPGAGSDAALSQTIYRLRNTMTLYDARRFVETVPNQGYRLSAESLIRPSTLHQDVMRPVFPQFQAAVVLHERRTEQSLTKAIEILEGVCRSEPSYLPAQEMLATAYLNVGTRTLFPAKEAYWRARQALERTLVRDSAREKSFSTLSTVLLYFNCDREAARAAAEHALLLAPQSPSAHNAAAWERLAEGDFEAALTHADLAIASNPTSSFSTALFGTILYMAGRYTDAHAVFDAVRTLDPQQHFALFYDACAHAIEENYDRSEDLLAQIRGNDSRAKILALRAYIAAKRGDIVVAQSAVETLRTFDPLPYTLIALVELNLRHEDVAASILEANVKARDPGTFLVAVDPLFEPLRERFPSLTDVIKRISEPRCDRCGETLQNRRSSELYKCDVCWSCRQYASGEMW